MNFPSTSPSAAGLLADRSWRLRHSAWLLAPIMGCGLLSFVGFVYVALRVRTKKFWIAALISCMGSAVLWVATATGDASETGGTVDSAGATSEMSDWAAGLAFAVWAGLLVYAVLLNRDYLRWRAGQDGTQAWYNQPAGNSTPNVGQAYMPPPTINPRPEPTAGFLGVSQDDYFGNQPHPNVPRPPSAPIDPATSGAPAEVHSVRPASPAARPHPVGPVDVNTASASMLASSFSIDSDLASRVVATRNARGGFANLDDMVASVGLQPHELLKFRGRAAFGVPETGLSPRENEVPREPREGQTGGRIVDI